MESRTKFIVGGVLSIVVISGILIIASLDSLEPREYGLVYNSIDKSIKKDTAYEGGRHFIGLFGSFIAFPKGYQTIEFSDRPDSKNNRLNARSSDGLSIGVSVSFQYQLIKNELPQLYEQSNTGYESTFVSIARDVLMQNIANYSSTQFWQIRDEITETMQSSLNLALTKAHASCVGLQLLKVTIPASQEKLIVSTQVETQLINTKTYERTAELIRQSIDIENSQCQQNITSITASATAQGSYITQVAQALSKKRTLDVQSFIYNKTRSDLNLSSDEFKNYLYLRSLSNQVNAVIIVGLNNSAIQIRT
jgi:SPFH domain / Band 7 family